MAPRRPAQASQSTTNQSQSQPRTANSQSTQHNDQALETRQAQSNTNQSQSQPRPTDETQSDRAPSGNDTQDQRSNPSREGHSSQKRAGRAPGSQGYTDNDCRAVVAAIKEVIPLGSNEWDRVVDMYNNNYARPNHCALRDEKSIRGKFRHLFQARKPTGDPSIKDFVREAKELWKLMQERAATYKNCDEEDEYESDDPRNGDGAPIEDESPGSLLSGWSETQQPRDQQLRSDGAAESGWSATPTRRRDSTFNNNDTNLPDLSDLGTMDSSRQSSRGGANSILQSSVSSTQSSNASTRPTLTQDRGTSRNRLVHRTESSRAGERGNPMSKSNRRTRTSNSDGLREVLQQHFDPDHRRERDLEEGMTAFYANRLQEANTTIIRLTDENRHLRDGINQTITRLTEENHRLQNGINSQILQLQDDKRRLQDEKTNLLIELQGLRSQLQLNQLRAEWQFGPANFYSNPPNGIFNGGRMGGPGYMPSSQTGTNSFAPEGRGAPMNSMSGAPGNPMAGPSPSGAE
ncbi:hypothetical protein Pst134EA_007614 [Puccinia striiformis f. sp. tritici]|uniref:hypothetical protein n=1 Tax=Puccinia striiformis f. sp. tritici TaxID=168172 RepID=UPI00200751F8|nr:hypothetical protein Pst134EA_007614 [Puccinia striiformis f. sp. tritici]KAH9470348.1 hypothetical protein Pst134EA_007614 [Puccinia striiformis f. sp. tritici]